MVYYCITKKGDQYEAKFSFSETDFENKKEREQRKGREIKYESWVRGNTEDIVQLSEEITRIYVLVKNANRNGELKSERLEALVRRGNDVAWKINIKR